MADPKSPPNASGYPKAARQTNLPSGDGQTGRRPVNPSINVAGPRNPLDQRPAGWKSQD